MYCIHWAHKKGPFYSSLPFDLNEDLGEAQIGDILRKERIAGLRFPVANGRGIDSGLYVCDPADYSLQTVNRRQRPHIRQGLEKCEVRRIDAEVLAAQGLELNRDTLGRHGRSEEAFLDAQKWQEFAKAVGDSPGMIAWGAFF